MPASPPVPRSLLTVPGLRLTASLGATSCSRVLTWGGTATGSALGPTGTGEDSNLRLRAYTLLSQLSYQSQRTPRRATTACTAPPLLSRPPAPVQVLRPLLLRSCAVRTRTGVSPSRGRRSPCPPSARPGSRAAGSAAVLPVAIFRPRPGTQPGCTWLRHSFRRGVHVPAAPRRDGPGPAPGIGLPGQTSRPVHGDLGEALLRYRPRAPAFTACPVAPPRHAQASAPAPPGVSGGPCSSRWVAGRRPDRRRPALSHPPPDVVSAPESHRVPGCSRDPGQGRVTRSSSPAPCQD